MCETLLKCDLMHRLTEQLNSIDEIFSMREQLKTEKEYLLKKLFFSIGQNNNAIYERYLSCCQQIDQLELLLLSKGCVICMPVV